MVFFWQGYHPHADDAALYVAGIEHLLSPHLFSAQDLPYIEPQTKVSVLGPLLADLVRTTGIRLEWALVGFQLLATGGLLYAVRRLALDLFGSQKAGWLAAGLAAGAFTIPIAGTALFVMDPYVTARTASAPLSLLMVVMLVERRWLWMMLFAALTLAFHPIMGGCALLFAVTWLLYTREGGPRWWVLGALAALLLGAMLWIIAHDALRYNVDYRSVVLTRTYMFLPLWAWFEYIGLIAPLLLCGALMRSRTLRPAVRSLCATIFLLGAWIAFCSWLLVRPDGSMLLARLQILRVFHLIYLVGIVLIGGWLAEIRSWYRWVFFAVFLGGSAVGTRLMQQDTFEGRPSVELPTTEVSSPWHQAFLWIGRNTPQNAILAADPNLMELHGEGHEGLRVTAERSVLGGNKDGGVVALKPELTAFWTAQFRAQRRLAAESDAERRAELKPFGVSWLLLPAQSKTGLDCPYRNVLLQVCRLP